MAESNFFTLKGGFMSQPIDLNMILNMSVDAGDSLVTAQITIKTMRDAIIALRSENKTLKEEKEKMKVKKKK